MLDSILFYLYFIFSINRMSRLRMYFSRDVSSNHESD